MTNIKFKLGLTDGLYKQKLMDRVDNFQRKINKKQNITTQSKNNDQEFELQGVSTYYNKEDTNLAYISDIESDNNNQEANTFNLEYFTAKLHKNYDHTSNDEETAETNNEEETELNALSKLI
uniref:Uncharacterized protein n=1 Tax=Gigaspora margarita TaxID=4874 RepID=A0A8H4EF44_GIGMA